MYTAASSQPETSGEPWADLQTFSPPQVSVQAVADGERTLEQASEQNKIDNRHTGCCSVCNQNKGGM